MRKIPFSENKQMGCEYCRDAVFLTQKTPSCPHEACPYQELEGHASYTDYLKANDMNFYNFHNERRRSGEGG